MEYTWLLLDADGTLFDYDKAEFVALATTFDQYALDYSPHCLETYRAINGQIWHDFEDGKITQEGLKARRFELLFEALSLSPASDATEFSERYLANLGDCAELIDGTADVLDAVHGRVHLALITNGLKEVQRSRLDRSGLEKYFEAVIISDEIGVSKPHAGIFDIAFARMGNPSKAEVLIVGDSLTSDIKGGSDYGIDTCWYNPTGKPRALDVTITHEIRDLADLLGIVGKPR
jgi:2-haloacid dehalogenase